MKKNKISKNWINKHKRDLYVRESKIQGFRSRSAFKLLEIDKKFNLFKNKFTFLDLGASPGGWTQVAYKQMKKAKILAVDIKEIKEIKNTNSILGDFTNLKIQEKILNYFNCKIDIVASDMAKNTTGNKEIDVIITGNLCLHAMIFSKKILKKQGIFISKIFMGSNFEEINDIAKKTFEEVKIFKPKSSKKESRENYIICKNLSNSL